MSDTLPIAISNTGPLISAFQSDSLAVLTELFSQVHVTRACITELTRHGWRDTLTYAHALIITQALTPAEDALAQTYAQRIANHPLSKDPVPANHLGEAEVMALAQRPQYMDTILLIDEQAARVVALNMVLKVSGFAGVLLLAVNERLLTPDEVKRRLELCRTQGTHYSAAFIERAYQLAKAMS